LRCSTLIVLASVKAFDGGGLDGGHRLRRASSPLLRALAPTPDGEGAVEAVLVLGLVWAGVDAGLAVAPALLARLLRFWLPMPPG
jgi:undecaprenyl-diphosphatase